MVAEQSLSVYNRIFIIVVVAAAVVIALLPNQWLGGTKIC